MSKKSYLVVDGHYCIHRVLHNPRLADLHAKDGTPTGGVYGFLKVLFATAKAPGISFDRLIVAWDWGSSKRRKKLFPGYRVRVQQEDVGEEGEVGGMNYGELFLDQKKRLVEWIRAMGCASLEFKKREADDIIYKLTELGDGSRFTVVSDDKDFFQLLSDKVHIYRPMAALAKNEKQSELAYVTPEVFTRVYGFKPKYYLFYKAMTGDSSDMVPGVKGIGEATAKQIVLETRKPKYLKKVCGEHKLARVRVAASHDARKIIERNLELFDMSREEFKDKEVRKIEEALTKDRRVDWGTLRRMADELDLDTVKTNLGRWMSVFRPGDGR